MRFPTCPPPLVGPNESDLLHADPAAWLHVFEAGVRVLPRFVVAYADVLGTLAAPWLTAHGYSEARCFFHAHFPQSERDGHTLCIYSNTHVPATKINGAS